MTNNKNPLIEFLEQQKQFEYTLKDGFFREFVKIKDGFYLEEFDKVFITRKEVTDWITEHQQCKMYHYKNGEPYTCLDFLKQKLEGEKK